MRCNSWTMPFGPIYAVRVFVYDLNAVGPFYHALGHETVHTRDDFRIDRTGGGDLIIEKADPVDSEKASLVGRFVDASFAIGDIGETCKELAGLGITNTSPPTRQVWRGMLAYIYDPAGSILTLVEVPSA